MITSKEHSGKPVISITDGKKLGEIKDLYLDQDMRQVAAVFLGKEGLISRKTLVIARSAVQVYGIDVWLVSGSDTSCRRKIFPSRGPSHWLVNCAGENFKPKAAPKWRVIDHVILDNEARVLGFGLGKVYSQGPLAERKAIARDAILNLGTAKEPMTINLAQAESLALPSA